MASAIDGVLRWLSVVLQVIGIALLLLGVREVRSWLDRTADASRAARRSFVQRLELRIENVRHWYARRRGTPSPVARHASDTFSISDSATATVTRGGAHPEGMSDHERLIDAETRLYGVQLQVAKLEQARADDERKLDQQRDQLQAEIREATRAGWQFITAGLIISALGIVLGAFA